VSPVAEKARIKPKATVALGRSKVTNKTATSIEVEVAEDGTVVVTDCCLEEQGIHVQ
jgi:hypothetical protein